MNATPLGFVLLIAVGRAVCGSVWQLSYIKIRGFEQRQLFSVSFLVFDLLV